MDTGNMERKSWWREDPEDNGEVCSPNGAPEGCPPRGGSPGEMVEFGDLPELPRGAEYRLEWTCPVRNCYRTSCRFSGVLIQP